MSNKFTTLVTNEGINLLQASSQQDKKIEFVKAIGSSTAYSTSQLSTVTYADITARAAKNQEGTVNNIVPDKTTTKMELLFDGHDVKSDYTLNSIFIIARLKDSSDYKVFAILKANQPQYINAYTGDGATNLQINVGVKFDNQDNVSLEINSAALATIGNLQNLSKSTAEKLASENTRATESEQALDKLIKAETKRASDAENTLRSETTAESNRAKGVENELDNKITSETTRATKAENDLAGKITSEQNRAMAKENSLDGKIIQVQTNLNAEQGRATGAEQKLGGRVDSEIARATKAESDIQNQVNAEKSRATAAEGNLNKIITDESNRAKGVENELRNLANSNRDRLNAKDNRIVIANKDEAIKDLIVVDDKHNRKGIIHSLDGDDYGSAVGIDNGGLTVLGGGEGALAILNNIVNKYAIDGTTYNPQDEVLMLASDADVKVIANTQNQNPSNYKISKFKYDGSVVFPGRVYSNGNGTSIEQQIVDERNRATNRENSIDSRVTSESNRAKGVESSLQSQINTEKSRAQGAEANLSNQINTEANRAKGVENNINANISKILGQIPTIEVTRDFTCINGTFNSSGPGNPNTADIVFLNFPTFQIMLINMWLNGIDIKSHWTRKDVIKIPKSHFKFTKGNLFPMVSSSRVNGSQALDVTFSLATGIVTVSTRDNTAEWGGDIGLLAVFHN